MVNLNDVEGVFDSIGKKVEKGAELVANEVKSFIDGIPSSNAVSEGNSLPFSKVPSNQNASFRRNIITWFVPEFGSIKMYINPNSLSYTYKKLISKEKTKGGYAIQYWGEDLPTITIVGTTGSSGIEGINALYEIYRAEQYAFDPVALTMASNNFAQNAAADLVNSGLNFLGGGLESIIGGKTGAATNSLVSSGLGGILGLQSPGANMGSNNFMTLAELACGVEMYYNGLTFRGFFESMTITEKDLLFDYTINFTVTQKRGYRTNYLPWQRSPRFSPSAYDATPKYTSSPYDSTNDPTYVKEQHSFSGKLK